MGACGSSISACDVRATAGRQAPAVDKVVLLLNLFAVLQSYYPLRHYVSFFTSVGVLSDYHVVSFSTACSLLNLKCSILRTENLLNKLSQIQQGFGLYTCISTRVAREQIP